MDQGKDKNKVAAGWFNRLFPSRFVEFETPLTPYNCYERLQKLPGEMAYLKAKSKFELANAGFQPYQLKWLSEKNVCEFSHYTNREGTARVRIQGKVFVSDIYEATLVQVRMSNNSRQPSLLKICAAIFLLLVFLFLFPLVIINGIEVLASYIKYAILTVMCLSLIFVVGLVIPLISRARANMKLLQLVLMEPDESKL